MARRFASLHNIVRALLSEAAKLKPHAGDESVHSARKRLKRIRAALRLQRAAIGEALYRAANKDVRDAARPLARVRDAAVLVESIKQLTRRIPGQRCKSHADQAHRLLLVALASSRRHLTSSTLRRYAARLSEINERMGRARAKAEDLESVQRGLKNAYQKGRAACADARRRPAAETLHEWRKQVKYLSNEVILMRMLFGARLNNILRGSRKLGALLGEDHDLVLLEAKLDEFYGNGLLPAEKTARSVFCKRIKRRRKKLQAASFRLGKRLYRRSPGKFVMAIKRSLQKRNSPLLLEH
jgi:CHAD domain-containing protein